MNRIRNRNTTLDQYYTCPRLVKQCVKEIKQYCKPEYIIDTSCGNNLFVKEMNLPYKSYDIDPPLEYFGEITKTNFLKQNFQEIVLKKNTLMGFNPPFGWRSQKAKQFILKMMLLKPKYIALILLEPTTTNDWQFTNYKTIFQKDIFCHVPCQFFVLEYMNTNYPIQPILPRKSTKKAYFPGLVVTRENNVRQNEDCIFVRFTGVNAGLEYYIFYRGFIFHMKFDSFKTKNYKIILENCFKHKVKSTTFTKIYYQFKNFKMMKEIIKYLHEEAPKVMNLKALRYNFNTCDVSILVNNYLKN